MNSKVIQVLCFLKGLSLVFLCGPMVVAPRQRVASASSLSIFRSLMPNRIEKQFRMQFDAFNISWFRLLIWLFNEQYSSTDIQCYAGLCMVYSIHCILYTDSHYESWRIWPRTHTVVEWSPWVRYLIEVSTEIEFINKRVLIYLITDE